MQLKSTENFFPFSFSVVNICTNLWGVGSITIASSVVKRYYGEKYRQRELEKGETDTDRQTDRQTETKK